MVKPVAEDESDVSLVAFSGEVPAFPEDDLPVDCRPKTFDEERVNELVNQATRAVMQQVRMEVEYLEKKLRVEFESEMMKRRGLKKSFYEHVEQFRLLRRYVMETKRSSRPFWERWFPRPRPVAPEPPSLFRPPVAELRDDQSVRLRLNIHDRVIAEELDKE